MLHGQRAKRIRTKFARTYLDLKIEVWVVIAVLLTQESLERLFAGNVTRLGQWNDIQYHPGQLSV